MATVEEDKELNPPNPLQYIILNSMHVGQMK